jgi:hypothetical protein
MGLLNDPSLSRQGYDKMIIFFQQTMHHQKVRQGTVGDGYCLAHVPVLEACLNNSVPLYVLTSDIVR